MLAVKCLRQNYTASGEVLALLDTFRRMVNDCIRIGLANDATTLKRLSLLSYKELRRHRCPSYYKLCAISRAAGILAANKKSMRRGVPTRSPYAVRPQLVSCYGFKIENGMLKIPLGSREYFDIPLNRYAREVLSEPALRARSFTLTPNAVSLTISKDVAQIECTEAAGVDRNLRNITYGDENGVIRFDISKLERIGETTKEIVASFKRDDARVRQRIAAKYGRRKRARSWQLLHRTTKAIVSDACKVRRALVLEDAKGLKRLYRRGNGQGRAFRGRLQSTPWWGEVERQLRYKAGWAGLPIVYVSARGTSKECPGCGESLQLGTGRLLWCQSCKRLIDRDVVAAMNLAKRGRAWFARSKGGAGEALKGNPTTTAIPRADAPKLAIGYAPTS